jgi:cytochrome oxidase assembly protein ShyY1
LGFLLRPSWVALTVGVLVFAVACFTVLAPWQLRRDGQRRALNDAVRASMHTPPQPIESVPPNQEWRPVTLAGSYLAGAEVVARLRTVLGGPAYEVLTPLRLDSGGLVLVDRGFVRPAARGAGGRGNQVPDYAAPPGGTVTVLGRQRRDEHDGGRRAALTEGGHRQVYAVNAATVAAASGLDGIRPGYVQLDQGQPGVLSALPLPQLDSGPFLSYALQWLTFGVMALAGWVLLVRRELAERASAATPGTTPRERERDEG